MLTTNLAMWQTESLNTAKYSRVEQQPHPSPQFQEIHRTSVHQALTAVKIIVTAEPHITASQGI
jgi:hypothetical protein